MRRSRVVRSALTILILATATGLIVPWGLSLTNKMFPKWREVQRGYSEVFCGQTILWKLSAYERSGAMRVHSICGLPGSYFSPLDPSPADRLIPDWASNLDDICAQCEETRSDVIVEAYGWPALAMSGQFGVGWELDPGKMRYRASSRDVRGALLLEDPRSSADNEMRYTHVLPLTPIVSGLIFDIFVYSGIYLLVLGGAYSVRRRLRASGGRCPGCAYDLRGDFSSGCPECGWRREDVP